MQRAWIAAAALAAATMGSAQLKAQLANAVPAPTPEVAVGPTFAGAAIAPRFALPASAPGAALTPAPARRPFGLPQTLMIVGGAALLTGAIIGDDAGTVLMVGGAVVGLYGLYLYLRTPSMAGAAERPALGVGYRLPTGT
ncbi:MAG: hypothetical protein IRY91_12805 [Gemmatimonadaceae bacterium]|nr:hypothetical protein [Gemmatimonadaceae bacterium]